MEKVLVSVLLLSVFCWSCSGGEDQEEVQQYKGPLLEADSIEILYSDSAIVRVQVQAPKQYEFASGNREFPEGIYVEFYETNGSVSSTLVADKAYYFRDKDRYTAVGNVVIEGRKESNRLDTDTLHWSPPKKLVFTEAAVRVIQGADTLRGQGLEAAQDFSTYEVLSPVGTVKLEEEENEQDTN